MVTACPHRSPERIQSFYFVSLRWIRQRQIEDMFCYDRSAQAISLSNKTSWVFWAISFDSRSWYQHEIMKFPSITGSSRLHRNLFSLIIKRYFTFEFSSYNAQQCVCWRHICSQLYCSLSSGRTLHLNLLSTLCFQPSNNNSLVCLLFLSSPTLTVVLSVNKIISYCLFDLFLSLKHYDQTCNGWRKNYLFIMRNTSRNLSGWGGGFHMFSRHNKWLETCHSILLKTVEFAVHFLIPIFRLLNYFYALLKNL